MQAYQESAATEHFKLSEYSCDCGGDYCSGFPVMMDYSLLKLMENLRQNLGRPIIITSGVRCEARNQEVGGIAASKHKKGMAADFYCPGVHYSGAAAAARDLGLGIIEYPEEQFVHAEV
ncbi:MAG: D-Ala-D-Ala carboxypeptidase family metallohydrolase [Eubacterium sp.]